MPTFEFSVPIVGIGPEAHGEAVRKALTGHNEERVRPPD